MPDEDVKLDATLDAAAHALRQQVPIREAWRDALLAQIDAEAAPSLANHRRRAQRVWSIRPPMAIAASIALLVVGAAGGVLLVRSPSAPTVAVTPVATAPAGAAGSVEPAIVRFIYVAPDARTVSIVGDFNGWNPRTMPLRRLADGRTWIAELPLAPGRYAYAFAVDGVLRADPTAPRPADDDFGVTNSVVMVRGS